MRENYREVRNRADVPPNAAFIHLSKQGGRAVAVVDLGDNDTAPQPLDPDLALFEASLALTRYDLSGLFVRVDDPALWDERWGQLIALRTATD